MPSSAKTPASSRHRTAATSGLPTKAPRRRASLPVGAGASGPANAKTRGAMRSRAMLAQAQPVRMALVRMSITKASGSFCATRPIAPQTVQKELEQAKGDAPGEGALGNGARLSANGLGLAQDKVDGRRKTDERDGGSEHAETPHKLKRTKAGVYPIVTKICAAIGVCAQQPAILTRTCDGVASM